MLTREEADAYIYIKYHYGDFNDQITWEDFSELMADIKKDARKETAEKFAERLKSHPIAKTWFLYNADGKINVVIDEICKEIIGE